METVEAVLTRQEQEVACAEYLLALASADHPKPGDRCLLVCEPFDFGAADFIPFLVRVTIGSRVHERIFDKPTAESALVAETLRRHKILCPKLPIEYLVAQTDGNTVKVVVRFQRKDKVA